MHNTARTAFWLAGSRFAWLVLPLCGGFKLHNPIMPVQNSPANGSAFCRSRDICAYTFEGPEDDVLVGGERTMPECEKSKGFAPKVWELVCASCGTPIEPRNHENPCPNCGGREFVWNTKPQAGKVTRGGV